ncbi:MAG TPA: ssl1498 family light-harvesting-like protein [Coleofasciculaceae cyanobacterium]
MHTTYTEKTAQALKARIAAIISSGKSSHHSDGRELTPAEVQVRMMRDMDQPLGKQPAGYTVNDEGLMNAYSLEPAMYFSEYPTPDRQRRYVVQMEIAALVIVLAVLVAFFVS